VVAHKVATTPQGLLGKNRGFERGTNGPVSKLNESPHQKEKEKRWGLSLYITKCSTPPPYNGGLPLLPVVLRLLPLSCYRGTEACILVLGEVLEPSAPP